MNVGFYRILGNDLSGRHGEDQTISNLKFILENESEFKNCSKWWVLNRIRNLDLIDELKALIENHGHKWLEIKYDKNVYKKFGLSPYELPKNNQEILNCLHSDDARLNYISHIACLAPKALYIINNNGARNFALYHGKQRYDWTLPWDGNCFLNNDAWDMLYSDIVNNVFAKYLYVPMQRVSDNSQVFNICSSDADDEPQLCFHSSSIEAFNENLMYGFKPKVELLKRLDIPGVWDGWGLYYPWSNLFFKKSVESHFAFKSSYTVRLSDGVVNEIDQHKIAVFREAAIFNTVKEIDISNFKIIQKVEETVPSISEKVLTIIRSKNVLDTVKINATDRKSIQSITLAEMVLLHNSIIQSIKSFSAGGDIPAMELKFFDRIKSSGEPLLISGIINHLFVENYNKELLQIYLDVFHEYLQSRNSLIVNRNGLFDASNGLVKFEDFSSIAHILDILACSLLAGKHSHSYDLIISSSIIVSRWLEQLHELLSNKTVSQIDIDKFSYQLIIVSNYFELVKYFSSINLWAVEEKGVSTLKVCADLIFSYCKETSVHCSFNIYCLFIIVSRNSPYIKDKYRFIISYTDFISCLNDEFFAFPIKLK